MPDMLDREAEYFRRRADQVLDRHLSRMEDKVDELDAKVDKLIVRVGVIGAAFGLAVVLANILGPVIATRIIMGT